MFSKSYYSSVRAVSFSWEISGLPSFIERRYTSLSELLKAIVFAESTIFSSRNHNYLRSKLCQNDELKKLSYDGQIPVFTLCHMLAYNIFSDANLRHSFVVTYPSGYELPLGVNRIYNNLRETRRSDINISFKQKDDTSDSIYKDTILCNAYLKKHPDAKNIAFTLLSGNLFSDCYGIKTVPYKEISFISNLNNCNSIVLSSHSPNEYHLDVTPWSTTQRKGRSFDPLVEHLYISLFGGSRLYDIHGQLQDYSSFNLNYFEVNITADSYWFQYIYFFIENPNSSTSSQETVILSDNDTNLSDKVRKVDRDEFRKLVLSLKSIPRKSSRFKDLDGLQIGYFIPVTAY